MVTLSLEPLGDLDRARGLLAENDLPAADLESTPVRLFDAVVDGDRVGIGGFEPHGDVGLLRSVVVAEGRRGRGLGEAICTAIEGRAAAAGVTALYLLTTDASGFFGTIGYGVIERDDAPAAIGATAEFDELCPDTATAMRKRL